MLPHKFQEIGETKEENELFYFKNLRTEIQVSCQNTGGFHFFNSATARPQKAPPFKKTTTTYQKERSRPTAIVHYVLDFRPPFSIILWV